MDEQVNPLERDHHLSVVLPGGLEKNATVHGSKPVMDFLVTLCASYRLNPSDYTAEFLSPNKNNISFKPNSPIGSLEADKMVLKPKGAEEKIRRPYMPEASVRLLINYNKSHKAVVRVSPGVPLRSLLPAVCDKCEFKVETTVLLRDSQSGELLDMSKTLNEHGLREVFAKDTAAADQEARAKTPDSAVSPAEVPSPSPPQDLPKSEKKQKRSTGFLSLFRRGKKKTEMEGELWAPVSLGFSGQVASSSNTLPADLPKKRRAPLPPMGASQSVPNDLGAGHLRGLQVSAESTLRSTKRRAPPPPCGNTNQEPQPISEVKGTVDSLNAMEELKESDETDSLSPASSPRPSQPWLSSSRSSFTHLHEMADPYLPSFRGKDLSDARSALAKVLTSSVSKGALVRRLRNSATFPKLHTGSPFMTTTPRRSHNGQNWAEPEAVSTFNLPSEPEWEDPVQRRGMTTFKVVPLKKFHDPELTPDDLDQIKEEGDPEGEGSPQPGTNQTETEEDLCSPDGSQTETPLQSPEEAQADRPGSLPPPFDLGDRVCPGSPLSQAGDTQQKEEDETEVTSEVAPAAPSDCSDGEPPSDGPINSEDQRELLQSPSRQPGTTGMDHCGSNTDEKEGEEEVVQEEEEEVVQEEEEEVVQEEEEEVVQEEEEEVVHEEEEEEVEDSFPPPPSPVFFNEDEEVMAASSLTSSPPLSPSSSGPTSALSEDHQSTSAGPEPPAAAPQPLAQRSAAPSRFAQAVALAVQRSRLQGHGKGLDPQASSGPHSALPSPHISIYQFGA